MSVPPECFLEVSRETALLLRLMDGTRDLETLARDVGRATGRELSANDVAEALDRTLGPLGLIEGIDRATEAPAGGAERPRAETSRDPGVSHGPALSARLVRRLAAALAPLHAPAIGIPLSAAALALHLLALRSLPALLARERMLLDPAWLVAIALLLPVLLIHELGHASALAYRGGAPGRVGIRRRGPGVVFYADVSDAARLARAGRIGVD